MTAAAPVRLLLGPQRPVRNLAEAIAAAGIPDGPLAVISAGWQEAEGDIDDVREVVGRPLDDLRLYARADEVFTADEKLAEAYRVRQDCLKEQQRLYRQRLRQLAIAARQTLKAEAAPGMLAAEQRHAIAQLRALDRHHLKRTELLHAPFARAFAPDRYPLLAAHRAEIGEQIRTAAGVLITGGNVVVLANRIRLFGVDSLLADTPLIGWSAIAVSCCSVRARIRSPATRPCCRRSPI